MQQPGYSTKTIFNERNDLDLFVLSVTRGGYNMNMRCNQTSTIHKDRGIDFIFWISRGYARDMCAQHFLGFPLYHPLDGKRMLSIASTAIKNQIFSAGVTKITYVIVTTVDMNKCDDDCKARQIPRQPI